MCTTKNQQHLCWYRAKRHCSNLHCYWWQKTSMHKLILQAIKAFVVASEWGYSESCVYIFTNTTELNQKLSIKNDRRYQGFVGTLHVIICKYCTLLQDLLLRQRKLLPFPENNQLNILHATYMFFFFAFNTLACKIVSWHWEQKECTLLKPG